MAYHSLGKVRNDTEYVRWSEFPLHRTYTKFSAVRVSMAHPPLDLIAVACHKHGMNIKVVLVLEI